MTTPLRAAIYARFSTDMQSDASIEDQVRACREYAARQGLEVVETYSDRAVSGASLVRSGIQRLLREARGGGFDVVISEGLDRFRPCRAHHRPVCFQPPSYGRARGASRRAAGHAGANQCHSRSDAGGRCPPPSQS